MKKEIWKGPVIWAAAHSLLPILQFNCTDWDGEMDSRINNITKNIRGRRTTATKKRKHRIQKYTCTENYMDLVVYCS